MAPILDDLLDTQGGIATRRQLVTAGLHPRAIRRAVASGQLRLVARGLYAASDPRPGEALRAAATRLKAVVSHESAAILWGIELVTADITPHVAVPSDRSRAAHPAVKVHRIDVPAEDITVRDGLRLTTPTRTVLDLARSLPLAEAVAVADSAVRKRLVTVQQLSAGLNTLFGRGRRRVAKVIALVDPKSGSVLESTCRVLFTVHGLPAPVTQHYLRTTCGWSGRVDFAWPGQHLIVEVDGFAFHSDLSAFQRDRRRDNALLRAGWRVIRLTYDDIQNRPEYVIDLVTSLLDEAVAAS